MRSIDIIIVNWNAGEQLARAVASIAKHHGGLVSAVIIVDNASTDDSLAQIDASAGWPFALRIVRNPTNLGFAAACNQGARMASGAFLLFLNPDTRLFECSLPESIAYLRDPDHQDVGIVGIQLLDEQSSLTRSCARFPTPAMFVAQALGIDRFPFLSFLNMHTTDWDHKETREVDHVIGAYFFVRKSLFDSLGGFDERFFVYLEDLDLSLRARQRGYRTVFVADAQAFHAGGGTSHSIKARRLFYSLRSRLLYSLKHFKGNQAMMVATATFFVEPWARMLFALGRGRLPDALNTCHAFGLLWFDLVNILRRRHP